MTFCGFQNYAQNLKMGGWKGQPKIVYVISLSKILFQTYSKMMMTGKTIV